MAESHGQMRLPSASGADEGNVLVGMQCREGRKRPQPVDVLASDIIETEVVECLGVLSGQSAESQHHVHCHLFPALRQKREGPLDCGDVLLRKAVFHRECSEFLQKEIDLQGLKTSDEILVIGFTHSTDTPGRS